GPANPHGRAAESLRAVMSIVLRALAFLVFPVLGAAIICAAAGRADLPYVWALFGMLEVYVLVVLLTLNRGLLRERIKPASGGADRQIGLLVLPFVLAHWIIAGLSLGRFDWGDHIPDWLRVVGLVGAALSLGLAYWSMRVNPFFSPVVRIQQ